MSSLIDSLGQVSFGRFNQTLNHINGRDANYLTAMGKPTTTFAKHFNYKQFQYFGVISDHFSLGCAFADTAWLGLAFFYFYDNQTHTLSEWTWRSPFSQKLQLSQSPRSGKSLFQISRHEWITMEYKDTAEGLTKTLSVNTKQVNAEAIMQEPLHYQPMSICTRTGINGFTYANKVAGIKAQGQVQIKGKHYDLAQHNSYGHHDYTAGYLRRETYWNWACTSAQVNGHDLGLNLSCGVNETSASENCLWLDQRLYPTGGIFFEYDRKDLFQPWQIYNDNKTIDLTFTPQGRHQEKLNLAFFASNFNQLFGSFNGKLSIDGKPFLLSNIPGFVEEQYAKW